MQCDDKLDWERQGGFKPWREEMGYVATRLGSGCLRGGFVALIVGLSRP